MATGAVRERGVRQMRLDEHCGSYHPRMPATQARGESVDATIAQIASPEAMRNPQMETTGSSTLHPSVSGWTIPTLRLMVAGSGSKTGADSVSRKTKIHWDGEGWWSAHLDRWRPARQRERSKPIEDDTRPHFSRVGNSCLAPRTAVLFKGTRCFLCCFDRVDPAGFRQAADDTGQRRRDS